MLGRWTDWQFVVPRLLLAIVVLLAAQYGLGVAMRTSLERWGKSALGGKVNIEHARVSIIERQVVLSGISVADPREPSQNFIEADRCLLSLQAAAALHKQAIIESGEITGLRFGSPRKADGMAAEVINDSNAKTNTWFRDEADKAAANWLDQVGLQFRPGRIEKFPSVKLTEDLLTRSSLECASLRERMQDLKRRSGELQQQVQDAQANRLRHAKFLDSMPEKMASLGQEFTQLKTEIEQQPATIEVDRRTIVAARRDDERIVRDQMRIENVDANALSAYLLREQVAEPLDEVLGWLRWTRKLVPATPCSKVATTRGTEVLFSGCTGRPDWLLRNLNLHGTARIGGQPLELQGTLCDVAADQSLHTAPLRLKVATTGSLPLVLQATLDRTGTTARDELIIDCRGILMPKQELGQAERLRLSLSPSVGTLNASMILLGDSLSGEIQLVQKEVSIKPALEGHLGLMRLSAALQDTLGDVHSFATRLSIRGTLAEPTCTLWSNLGPAVAESMDRALVRAADKHCRELLANAQRNVDERLAQLDRQIADSRSELLPQLATLSARLEQIANQQSTPPRLNPEYLGRRLPSNSLFR